MQISFFVYPRPMVLTRDPNVPDIIKPIWCIVEDDNVTFTIENSWLLYNPNYLPVTLLNFTIQLSWYFQPSTQVPFFYANRTQASLPPRSDIKISQVGVLYIKAMTSWFHDEMA